MLDLFKSLFRSPQRQSQTGAGARVRLSSDQWPALLYAIGDVHGCLDELQALESAIVADAEGVPGEKWIILLGDLIDRGPNSAGVVRHVMAPAPAGFRRFCLTGNHEDMLLRFLEQPRLDDRWLQFGGWETLASYGLDTQRAATLSAAVFEEAVRSLVPAEHLGFLGGLPSAFSLPGTILVHAGIRPGIPIEAQDEEDLLWIREPFLNAVLPDGIRVVHGHTPAAEPEATPHRLGIDTGAFATGRLTAARLDATSHRFLQVGGSHIRALQ